MRHINDEITSMLVLQGYQTDKYIASSIGASERTVRRHLDDLIKRGTIKMVAVQNPVLCGFKAWSKIGIKIEPGCLETVARTLVEHPAVYFVAYSLGRYDIIIAVQFDTINRLAHFVSSELTVIKGISNSETLILASPRKYYSFYWPNPEALNQDELVTDNANCLLNDLDRDIINELREDALVSTSIISSKLGVSDMMIHKRIKRMLTGNVLTTQVVLNPQILGNEVWATMGIVINKRNANDVIDIILKNSQIYLASVSLGRFNVVIAGHFQNLDLLNSYVTRELVSIDGVGSVETFVHNKPLKYHNVPLFELEAKE